MLVAAIAAVAAVVFMRQSADDDTPKVDRDAADCFQEINGERIYTCDDKPIIYLYPEGSTEVTVKLGNPKKLVTVYPEYNDGWRVLATSSGKLTDLNTGRSQYALYWEGSNYPAHMHETGFVVKSADTAKFLEEKLATLGLSEREANEFIIYWLPKTQHNPYNYIYFATTEKSMNICLSK